MKCLHISQGRLNESWRSTMKSSLIKPTEQQFLFCVSKHQCLTPINSNLYPPSLLYPGKSHWLKCLLFGTQVFLSSWKICVLVCLYACFELENENNSWVAGAFSFGKCFLKFWWEGVKMPFQVFLIFGSGCVLEKFFSFPPSSFFPPSRLSSRLPHLYLFPFLFLPVPSCPFLFLPFPLTFSMSSRKLLSRGINWYIL